MFLMDPSNTHYRIASSSSSSPPLAKIITSCRFPSCKMRRTFLDNAIMLPLSAADPAHGNSCFLQPRRQFDDFSGRGFGIVGDYHRQRPGR